MADSDLVGPRVIHNTVCSLLLRESKIYREIAVLNMWWMNIIVVALLAFGIVGFVSLVRLFAQRLTSETTRRAEDMYDQYADSPRERHRRSLAPRSLLSVLPNRVSHSHWGSPRARGAWLLAWPSPSGPLDSRDAQAGRSSRGHSVDGSTCGAPRDGVRRIRVHDPRRTCGSLPAAFDVHLRVAMRILRHSKIAITM